MPIIDHIPRITLEIQSFLDAPDRRAYLTKRVGTFFDHTIEPLDLPGPDRFVDPMLRNLLCMVVTALYDAIDKAIQSGHTITWAALPAPETPETPEEVQP